MAPKKVRLDAIVAALALTNFAYLMRSSAPVGARIDANESIFFARDLEHVMAATFDVLYPEYKATRLFPVNTEAGPGAESITYRQFDRTGMMKIISNYADGLPRMSVKAKEFTTPVRPIGGSYGYNIDEIRAARFANRPLETLEAESARAAYEQTVNEIAWFAKSDDNIWGGLTGILYQPNITVGPAVNGTAQSGWLNANCTPDMILKDMNMAVANMLVLTKGVEMPDTMLLPLAQWSHITSTPRSINSDTTIAEYFLKNNPSIRNLEAVNELAAVNPKPSAPTVSASTNLMIVYRRDPRKVQLHIPQTFEQFPPEQRGLEFVIACHAKVAGIITPYPLSIAIYEGI